MTTAVTPNNRKIWKIRPLKEKHGKKYGQNIFVLRFWSFSLFFCAFLRSWRPGRLCKSFLKVVRFSCAEYESAVSHPPAKCFIFHVFRPPFRPTGSSIPPLFVEKHFLTKEVTPLDPSHKIRIKILHKMMCLPATHNCSWTRSWQEPCFCSKPFYLNFVMVFQPQLLLQSSKTHITIRVF